ncbi:hypothetical protein AX17_004771 [Amanita inopinata Kibby_2008]|nr:hypothetical protein AX17_004771 [Amanita inopinata Kibby_2008]
MTPLDISPKSCVQMTLEVVGTPAFLPTLVSQLHHASETPIPLDPVILQSILLVLAAGQRKHLILNAVHSEDVGLVARIAEWTLSTVFNLPTHRLKIRSPEPSASNDSSSINPAAFLRNLFLSKGSPSIETSQDEMASSSASVAQLAHHAKHPHRKSIHKPGPKHSTTATAANPFSDDLTTPSDSNASQSHHPLQSDPKSWPNHPHPHSHPHHPRARKHAYARHSSSQSPRRSQSKSKSRPTSATAQIAGIAPTPAISQIPNALIVSGLERASDISQQAVVRVLADGRVVLRKTGVRGRPGHDAYMKWKFEDEEKEEEEEVWDLPEEFIMIYVTSWNPRERPAIHKSLLDKFAMSTNIVVQPKTRHALRSLSTASTIGSHANPFATPGHSPLVRSHSIPSTPRSISSSLPHHHQSSSTPHQKFNQLPPSIADTQVPSTSERTYAPSPPVVDATDQLDVSTFLPLPSTFLPHLRSVTQHHTYFSPTLRLYLQDLFTATRHDSPQLDGMLLTARSMEDAEVLARACRVLGTEMGGWELIRGGVEYMSGRRMDVMDEEQGDKEKEGGSSVEGSGHGYDWEFESGYDPSGSIVIDVGFEDESVKGRGETKREKVNEHRQERKVTFEEDEHWISEVGNGTGGKGRMLDVSEADVARIMPRVISHRVRMRDGWMDEVLASAVAGATSFPGIISGKERKREGKGREETIRVEKDEDVVEGVGEQDLGEEPKEGEEEEMTVKDALVRVLQRV